MSASPNDVAPAYALLLLPDGDAAEVRAFGLTGAERLTRALRAAGVGRVVKDPNEVGGDGRVLVIRADHFYDERITTALVASADDLVLCDATSRALLAALGPAGEVARLSETLRTAPAAAADESNATPPHPSDMSVSASIATTDLVPAYDPKLRKHSPPFVLAAKAEHVRQAERRIFSASYKGITDFVTKWVFPAPARLATRWCAGRGIVPNTVTYVSYGLVVVTALSFWQGWFALGLVSAWLMTFLDTVDGKLARCTLNSSAFGNVLDHGLDLVHPPIWWAAWAAGLALPGTGFGAYEGWVWIVVGGYVVGRLLEGVFLAAFKQEMFTWRPFDGRFRQVIARRNPNLVLLSGALVAGRPDLGFIAVGVWTLACLGIQCVRIGQAFGERRRGGEIRSWYKEIEEAK